MSSLGDCVRLETGWLSGLTNWCSRRTTHNGWVAYAVLTLQLSCSSTDPGRMDEKAVATHQAVSQKVTLSVTMPSGAQLHALALGASDQLTVADGVAIKDKTGNGHKFRVPAVLFSILEPALNLALFGA